VKRFAFIAMIAVIVLAMTAGTAFASVCFGPRCDGPMRCETGVVDGHAGMHEPSGSVRGSCSMGDNHRTSDISASQSSSERPAPSAVTPTVAAPPALVVSVLSVPVPADARGAPHLSAVLRL
jgi:hypothetical protein